MNLLDTRLEHTRWAETLQGMESLSCGEVVSGEAVNEWLRSWGTSNELPMPKSGQ